MKTRFAFSIQLFLWITLAFILPACAGAMDGQTVSLEQALDMALKNDSQVFTARNNLEKAKLAVKMEVLKTWPQATITDTFGDVLQNPMTPSNPHYNEFQQFPNMLTITITETIPTQFNLYGKKVPTSIEAAIWEQVNSEAQFQITQASVIYNTMTLYCNGLKAGHTVRYQEGVVESVRSSLAIAREQLRQNKITKPDELKVENDLAAAVHTLEKNRSDYYLALRQLGNQIGMNDITGLKLMEPSLDIAREIGEPGRIKENAVKKRLEMKQAEITILKAGQQLALAQNQALPDLNFGYTYHNSDRTESLTISYSFLSGDINGNVQKIAGDTNFIQANNNTYNNNLLSVNELTLKLTWKLDFGTSKNQVMQNQLLLANAKKSGAQTKQGIEWEVEQAFAAFDLAVKKVEISRQAIPYYEKQLEIKRLQVKLGMAPQSELADAENNLTQALNQVKNDEYDQFLADKKLRMVSGELYPFQSPNPNSK